jgi:hypothetical protein
MREILSASTALLVNMSSLWNVELGWVSELFSFPLFWLPACTRWWIAES